MRLGLGKFALIYTFFVSLGFFTIWIYLALYLKQEFQMNAAQVGLILGALPLVSAALSWLGGAAADRFGDLTMVRITSLGFLCVAIGLAMTRDLTLTIIILLLFGFLRAGNVPIIRSMLSQADAGDGRLFRIRYIVITVSVCLVAIMGLLWRPSDLGSYFYVGAGLYFIAGIIAIIGHQSVIETSSQSIDKTPKPARYIVKNKWAATAACILFGFTFWFCLSQFESNFPLYLEQRFGETGKMIYKINILVGAASALFLSLAADQFLTRNKNLSEIKIIISAAICMAISFSMVFTLEWSYLIYLGAIIFVVGEVIILPKIDSIAIPLAQGKNRSMMMGLLELRQAGFFVGPFVGGLILDWNWKFMAPFFFFSSLLIILSFMMAKRLVESK